MKILRALLLALLVVLVAGAGFLAWLLYSEGGARFALEGLSGRQLVKAQLVSGGLLGPLSVADLSYENRSVRVEIDRAELTW
ncbi:MAG TPA: hypothetical protein VM074_07030, partial [Solimonas sp.]|nr:hypothetical protein [Solimonas sp.]